MTEMGFKLVECDNSIWVFLKGKTRIIVPVYVDDITIAGESKSEVKWVKDELKRRFKLRDLGPVSFLLGVHVTRDRSKRMLSLSQRQAIVDMLKKFDMEDCKPVGTPLDPGSKLSIADSPQTIEDAAVMRSKPYAEAVGTLMYIAIATRHECTHQVGVLKLLYISIFAVLDVMDLAVFSCCTCRSFPAYVSTPKSGCVQC